MIAYRKSDFDQLAKSEVTGVPASPFYTPNIFIRIGLFIFGSVCAQAFLGLFFLMTSAFNSETGFHAVLILFALLCLGVLEALIHRPKPFFRAGLEEALLYGALTALYFSSSLVLKIHSSPPFGFTLVFGLIVGLAAIRYVDSLLATLALAFEFFTLITLVSKWGGETRLILPLLMIAVSALIVKGSAWALRKDGWEYWDHLWTALRFACLLSCYAGGNYWVVREMSQALFGLSLAPGKDIPLAMAFYLFTFAVPLCYIGFGLAKKDRLFLTVGLLCLAWAVFTYKYYHHTMPIEWGLTLGGVALISVAWMALRLFKPIRFGITANPESEGSKEGTLNIEGLAVLNILPNQSSPNNGPENLQGGGGNFGGAGASGSF